MLYSKICRIFLPYLMTTMKMGHVLYYRVVPLLCKVGSFQLCLTFGPNITLSTSTHSYCTVAIFDALSLTSTGTNNRSWHRSRTVYFMVSSTHSLNLVHHASMVITAAQYRTHTVQYNKSTLAVYTAVVANY